MVKMTSDDLCVLCIFCSDYHGTRCAGVVGAKANNDFCGVGTAPDVQLAGRSNFLKHRIPSRLC